MPNRPIRTLFMNICLFLFAGLPTAKGYLIAGTYVPPSGETLFNLWEEINPRQCHSNMDDLEVYAISTRMTLKDGSSC